MRMVMASSGRRNKKGVQKCGDGGLERERASASWNDDDERTMHIR